MGASDAGVAKVICFSCRSTECRCHALDDVKIGPPPRAQLAWAVAWLGGACVAGTAVGALLAMLLGGG